MDPNCIVGSNPSRSIGVHRSPQIGTRPMFPEGQGHANCLGIRPIVPRQMIAISHPTFPTELEIGKCRALT